MCRDSGSKQNFTYDWPYATLIWILSGSQYLPWRCSLTNHYIRSHPDTRDDEVWCHLARFIQYWLILHRNAGYSRMWPWNTSTSHMTFGSAALRHQPWAKFSLALSWDTSFHLGQNSHSSGRILSSLLLTDLQIESTRTLARPPPGVYGYIIWMAITLDIRHHAIV